MSKNVTVYATQYESSDTLHFWIERTIEEGFDGNEQLLCVSVGANPMPDTISITIIPADVTCKECLEWLHA